MQWIVTPHSPGLRRAALSFVLAAVVVLAAGSAAAVMEIGANDVPLGLGGTSQNGRDVDVAYAPDLDEYFVVWAASDAVNSHVWGLRIERSTGLAIGTPFQVSTTDGAGSPAVAYNETEGTYLVVWHGSGSPHTVGGDVEIFGQIVAAATGIKIGPSSFRVSTNGPEGNIDANALVPDVVYGAANNEFLVVWAGDTQPAYPQNVYQIFGQRIAGLTGLEVGGDFQISAMNSGGNGFAGFDTGKPAVAYDSVLETYLVVWWGESSPPLTSDETEIFGQRLSADGLEIGADDFRISDTGVSSSSSFETENPDVAFNPVTGEFLVVWQACEFGCGPGDPRWQIYGQRISSSTGAEVGANDFRIAEMGTDGAPGAYFYDGEHPAVAYDSSRNEWIVVWQGDPGDGPLVSDEYEIFVQRLTATGIEVGADDFRLSDMGTDGDASYDGFEPAVAVASASGEAIAVWHGSDTGAAGMGFFQRFTAAVAGPVCGDGVLETGEQCEAPFGGCCNPTTCQFESAATLCRASGGDSCDPDEFCTGASDQCPADIPLPDGSSCDDGDACVGFDTCQAGVCEPFSCGEVDAGLKVVKNLALKIAPGNENTKKTVRLNVRNNEADGPASEFELVGLDGTCPPGTAGTPDFDSRTPGVQNRVLLEPRRGTSAKAVVTVRNVDFTLPNTRSANRCRVSYVLTPVDAVDPTPENAVSIVNIDVVDRNDPDQATAHDSGILTRPDGYRFRLRIGETEKTKTLRFKISNRDAPGSGADLIGLTWENVSCPAGTVTAIDCDSSQAGNQSSVLLDGGRTARCSVTFVARADDWDAPVAPGYSEGRCTLRLNAVGPLPDPEPSNNVHEFWLLVRDGNDN